VFHVLCIKLLTMQEIVVISIPQLQTLIVDAVNACLYIRDQEQPKQAPAALPAPDEYLTRQQAADKLMISLPTLNELTKGGKLPGYRIGNRLRYKATEIQQALTQIKTGKKL